MAYNEQLAQRVREVIAAHTNDVEEKKMFSGMCFMVKGKMCICISGDELMCRIDPEKYEESMERPGTRPMIHRNSEYRGYLYVSEEGYTSKKDFMHWVNMCLAYNKEAKSSKKKTGGLKDGKAGSQKDGKPGVKRAGIKGGGKAGKEGSSENGKVGGEKVKKLAKPEAGRKLSTPSQKPRRKSPEVRAAGSGKPVRSKAVKAGSKKKSGSRKQSGNKK